MPKRPTEEPEFDIDDTEEGVEDGFEIDMDVVERIATALEAIAKVLVDREAKFAARPPRPSFGDRDRSGPPRGRPRDGDDERPARGSFSKPGYGEKTFRSGPGLGYSDRPARGPSRDRDGGERSERAPRSYGDKPSGGKGFGAPRGGKPAGKGAPRGRG